jgi:hypothetical protein
VNLDATFQKITTDVDATPGIKLPLDQGKRTVFQQILIQ